MVAVDFDSLFTYAWRTYGIALDELRSKDLCAPLPFHLQVPY